MTKKYFFIASALVALLSSCEPDETPNYMSDTGLAYVSYTNVNASGKQTNVFVDGVKVNNVLTTTSNTGIATNATITGTYIGVAEGSHTLLVKDSNLVTSINYFTGPLNVENGKSYSFFLYDTLTAGNLKGILLTTDRNPDPNPMNAGIRFLNLSPRAPLFDFWAVRMQGTTARDSVLIASSAPYLGNVASPDINSLSAFKSVLASQATGAIAPGSVATTYIFKVRLAGTNTQVLASPVTTIAPGRKYTYYTRGLYGTSSFALTGVLSN